MPNGSLDHRLSQYQPTDSGNFSSQDLSRSYWLVTHKVFFRNILIGLLLLADILLAGYAITGFASYLIFGRVSDNNMLADLARRVNSSTVSKIQSQAAQPLQYGTPQIFDNGNGSFDFVTEVQNPNSVWYAQVTYGFDVAGSTSSQTRTTLILPNENKYLTVLGERRDEASIVDASFHVISETWTRVDPHVIDDIPGFMLQHMAFQVDNPQFAAPDLTVTPYTDSISNAITFDIVNNTPFNYWSVPLQVVLLRGGQVQGIEEIQVDKFRTAQKRSINVHNFVKDLVVDEVRVIPTVDIFDSNVYMNQ